MLYCVFGIIWYRFVAIIFLYSVDFGIKWYRKWTLLYLALPAIRGEAQLICTWRVLKYPAYFSYLLFGIMWYRSGYWFFIRYKTYFFIYIWHGIETHVWFRFFLSWWFFSRKQRYVESDRIIWQAMQDKALSTKRANCLYYRDLRVAKRAFLWTKWPQKFSRGCNTYMQETNSQTDINKKRNKCLEEYRWSKNFYSKVFANTLQ